VSVVGEVAEDDQAQLALSVWLAAVWLPSVGVT
jgi:hypothetical protein